MEHVTISCPNCAKSFDVPRSLINRKGRCESCGTKFIIEEPSTGKAESVPAAQVVEKTAVHRKTTSPVAFLLIATLALGAGAWWYLNPHASYDVAIQESTAIQSPTVIDGEEGQESIPEKTVANEAGPDTPRLPALKPLDQTFPVQRDFAEIDIRSYQQTYPNVHMGWMPSRAEQAEEAKRWANYLGPLGVMVRSHVPQLQNRAAFAAIVPKAIQTGDGGLGFNAAGVISVAPGSPAEGFLQEGDLIVGIEGEPLLSGKQYRPELGLMHQDARELQLMFGEKIDAAQARGDIRLTVLRAPESEHQVLPVTRQELWSGQGGNQSTGIQTFEVDLPGEGVLTLVSDQFDDSINGDGTMWMDVKVYEDGKATALLREEAQSVSAGYGRPDFKLDEPQEIKGETFRDTLNLHAHGLASWKVPAGASKVSGSFAALAYGQVQPKIYFTPSALPLTGWHKDHLVEVRFPIGKVGSFGDSYPKNCKKTELTVGRHTDWLAAQQREDGSWPRLAGYTRDGWDTAWCALALMSSGDSKYDEQVKKAAYRVAYADGPSEWIAERAMRLIFLSEYYLRHKDPDILAGIQAAYHQVMDCCKTDYMSGHKVNGFGYGIAGQHYGTGHLALAVAMASRTPITVNEKLVDGIIRHAGEVCVNGTYAYGRGRRMARDSSRKYGGGHAMSGSGVLGVQIGGGHSHAVQEHTERMLASLGDGDNSHATSSLAFIFSSLALAAADEDAFIKHMQAFRYKMTLDDNWEGGFLKSAFPLDFQGGEGVTSSWIRSAGSILVLNALKHELAITGKKELWSEERLQTVPVSEWGGQIHSYYLRNWCLAKELLGPRAPKQLTEGIRRLYHLERDMSLVPKTRSIVTELVPEWIDELASDDQLSPRKRAYAIELLCGLDFRIFDAREGESQKVDLTVNLPLHELNWLDQDKSELFVASPFDLQSKVVVKSPNFDEPMVFETSGTEGFNLEQGTRKLSQKRPLKKPAIENFGGTAEISFKLGNSTISYERPLRFNEDFSHSNHYNLRRLKLRLRLAPRAYFQSQPMIIAGIPFDCMYPAERMPLIEGPDEETDVDLHEGDQVIVDISSENMICAWVHRFQLEEDLQVDVVRASSQKAIRGEVNGSLDDLYDFDEETGCEVKTDQSTAVIEYDFGQPVTLNGLDLASRGGSFIRVWYQQGQSWIPLVWDNYSSDTSHHPTFPDTESRLWRVEFQHGGSKKFGTLRFYRNRNRLLRYDALIQSRQKEAQPPIQPE